MQSEVLINTIGVGEGACSLLDVVVDVEIVTLALKSLHWKDVLLLPHTGRKIQVEFLDRFHF